MRQYFTYFFSRIILAALVLSVNFAFASESMPQKIDTAYLHLQKSKITFAKTSYPKNGLHLALPPLKPAATSSVKVNVFRPDDKLLLYVQVYPNPITDQIVNLKYQLSRNANVTIKLMDILGNDVATLVSQRIGSGEQTFSYVLSSQLTKGFYYIRVVAGTESVIKRISVL